MTRDSLPPGPRAPAFWQLVRWIREPIPFLLECRQRYGACFTVRFPNLPPYVLFSEPEAIQEIFLADPDVLQAGKAHGVLRPLLGDYSLLTLDGERHRRHRRLMTPPFHGQRMHAYAAALRDVTHREIERWPVGEPFPIHLRMQSITLEIMLRAVFGLMEGPRLTEVRERVLRLITFIGNPRGLGAGLAWWLQRDLGLLTPWQAMLRARRDVMETLLDEMTRRRASGADGTDILSLLLSARDDDGQPMTDAEVLDELVTMIFAGHETTATALAWCFHRLLGDPAVMGRVMDELHRVAGTGPLEPQRASDLVYLDATIKETLRVNPILAQVGRRVTRPMRIGGRDLPAGVHAVTSIYLTHHNPTVWPDPERFVPERFLGIKPSPYAWLPFGGGTRHCLGMSFALYEMRLILAETLLSVRLRSASRRGTRPVRRGITFAPWGGTPVVVEGRAGGGA
jgi:cytochrome P450